MGRSPAIDWEEARRFYVGIGPTRTYVRVADRFAVSDTAVRKRAQADGWREQARALDAKAATKADARFVESYSTRVAKRLEQVDVLIGRLIDDVLAGKVEVKASDFANLARLEQLLSGGATDRVEVHEVREIVAAFARITAENVPRENRGRVLEQLAELERTFTVLELPAVEAEA